jgi:conjugative transfer region protein TrbK
MNVKLLVRLGALAFVIVAILAAAIEFRRKDDAGPPTIVATSTQADPLRSQLQRCRPLGEAGARDKACLRAWAENLQRFMAGGVRPQERFAPGSLPAAPGAMSDRARPPADKRQAE